MMVMLGNFRDVPGVETKCVRGKYVLPHMVKKTNLY